jgi:lipoprotein-anchoring transpeptidase ErfK/SrfK
MPYAMFITEDGIALHSSVLQPRHATHGCVGLPDEFSRRLFEIAEVGTTVEIVHSDTESIERHLTATPASIH